MARILGRVGGRRRKPVGTFPCPRCGEVRAYDVVRSLGSMRCRACAALYEPMVDGRLNLRQVADWNHRVARLVATVGVAAGRGRPIDHHAAAHAFLLGRGWFAAEADGVVGSAWAVSADAVNGLIDELVVALDIVQSVTRTSGMELIVLGLAEILAVGGSLDIGSEAILVRCGDAAGVDRNRLADVLSAASGAHRLLVA